MDKREDVITALELCTSDIDARTCVPCELCKYHNEKYHGVLGDGCCNMRSLQRDILALLKAQEPRVMTWEEAQVNVNEGPFIILEVRDSTGTEIDYGVLVGDSYEMSEGSLLTVCDFWMLEGDYGKRFRCWTSRPTDEQRKHTPWND